jgi:hypothetical protein
MSIRQMLPIGTHLRTCPICQYPITAQSDELTAHELACAEELMQWCDELHNRLEGKPNADQTND